MTVDDSGAALAEQVRLLLARKLRAALVLDPEASAEVWIHEAGAEGADTARALVLDPDDLATIAYALETTARLESFESVLRSTAASPDTAPVEGDSLAARVETLLRRVSSVRRFEKKHGIANGTLGQIASGKRPRPSAAVLVKIAIAFGVPVATLIGGEKGTA